MVTLKRLNNYKSHAVMLSNNVREGGTTDFKPHPLIRNSNPCRRRKLSRNEVRITHDFIKKELVEQ